MTSKTLTVSALIALGFAGGLLTKSGGESVVLIPDPPAGLTEIKDDTKSPILEKIEAAKADVSGLLRCERGSISNFPDRCYCTDGISAGFLLEEENAGLCDGVLVLVDGKLYTETK